MTALLEFDPSKIVRHVMIPDRILHGSFPYSAKKKNISRNTTFNTYAPPPTLKKRRPPRHTGRTRCSSLKPWNSIWVLVSKNRGMFDPPKWMVKWWKQWKTLFFNGWFGGFSHYFWVDTHIILVHFQNFKDRPDLCEKLGPIFEVENI